VGGIGLQWPVLAGSGLSAFERVNRKSGLCCRVVYRKNEELVEAETLGRLGGFAEAEPAPARRGGVPPHAALDGN
jgi:hypothetical protein